MEARQAEQAAVRYLTVWETDIARSILMNENIEESEKILSQLSEFHPSLRLSKADQEICQLPVHTKVSLFSMPAADVLICRDPKILLQEAALSPLFLGTILFITIFVLIGLHREHRAQLMRLTAEARAAAESKLGELSRQVAHDIRGPLSALFVLAEKSKGLPADEKDLLSQASLRISEIAQDLLDRSRGETLQIKPEESVGLCHPDQVIENLKPELVARFPSIAWNFSLQAGTVAAAVPTATLQRILSNLAQNAVEASPAESTVSVVTRVHSDALSVLVADSGHGIEQVLLDQLNEGQIVSQKENGNGLGLKHARQVLEGMGGRLILRSKPGMGTQIELLIPKFVPQTDEHISDVKNQSSMTKPNSFSSVR